MTAAVGERIRKRAAERDLRATDIAKAMQVPAATVRSWTNGRRMPRAAAKVALASVLGCSYAWLFHGVEEPALKLKEDRPIAKIVSELRSAIAQANDVSIEDVTISWSILSSTAMR